MCCVIMVSFKMFGIEFGFGFVMGERMLLNVSDVWNAFGSV